MIDPAISNINIGPFQIDYLHCTTGLRYLSSNFKPPVSLVDSTLHQATFVSLGEKELPGMFQS